VTLQAPRQRTGNSIGKDLAEIRLVQAIITNAPDTCITRRARFPHSKILRVRVYPGATAWDFLVRNHAGCGSLVTFII